MNGADVGVGWWVLIGIAAALALVVLYDVLQRRHPVLHNWPVIGHLRYILEAFGPELRQYIVTNNDDERPFNRNQRRWIYATSKGENNAFSFGSDAVFERSPGYILISPTAFPAPPPAAGDPDDWPLASAKVLGGPLMRPRAFRPPSVVNVSGMSFGALSATAVRAMNEGAHLAGCLHNTGEGGLSPHHLHGGDLVLQLGTGWFGARDERGRLSIDHLLETIDGHPVRAIELKLSQGAKPGLGGLLPAHKVTPEIARIRGVPAGVDCVSPSVNPDFHDADGMLDAVERIAEATGLPVGIKSAVGMPSFWDDLARLMESGTRGVDFITIDGGEGGTGAGPLAFVDHVALPYRLAQGRAYRALAERGLQHRITWIGSGRLGLPEQAVMAFALGADMVNVGREAMMSVGCIQAQRCHTGRCPTGIATQSAWLQRGLDPSIASVRLAAYVVGLRREITRLARATGCAHPSQVTLDHIEILEGDAVVPATGRYDVRPEWAVPPGV
ncbi:MAG: FMN-binding glutamate synthase family protein [Thermoleophilia bacterium]